MRKIFILEDDKDIRDILEIILTSENYSVESFPSIGAFNNRDTRVTPDLYLFDVMLPDGSGIDVCKEIRKSKDNIDVPVLIMSAHANSKDLNGVCEADGFISKPFDIEHVINSIRVLIN